MGASSTASSTACAMVALSGAGPGPSSRVSCSQGQQARVKQARGATVEYTTASIAISPGTIERVM